MSGRGPRITASYACPLCRASDGIGFCHDPAENPMGDDWECVGRIECIAECCGRVLTCDDDPVDDHGPATGATTARIALAKHLAETHGYEVDPVALHVDGPHYEAQ